MGTGTGIDEVVRQVRMAVHDAQVAFDCVGLGEMERARDCMITAKAALDAAETVLQHGLARFALIDLARDGAAAVAAVADELSGLS
ncbi:hypothetical protein [Actinomadura roseirufa]|uniref:hypothetical protein n=1 Tax=Actinomadura roseirufa TaxID=2094049 RepID=UPI001F5E52E6|nr:hypothetical protein [Actinomadura roseirufa]